MADGKILAGGDPATHVGVGASSIARDLSEPMLTEIVREKATCPFIGTAVATRRLPVRNEAANPLASIEDVRQLGNSGGGDLGDLLAIFATGNHAFMRGLSGRLDEAVPAGLFSLEFPGSQGSHPGHSGILEGDPKQLGAGRFSEAEFRRLADCAEDGVIKRSVVGRFIAENLIRDPESKVFGTNVVGLLAGDLGEFVRDVGPALLATLTDASEAAAQSKRQLEEKLTRLLGEDNLVGSAGEFALLFTFLANKPGAKRVEGEPAVSLADVESMFARSQFPTGWDTWKKTRLDWVANTTGLLISAGRAYLALRKGA